MSAVEFLQHLKSKAMILRRFSISIIFCSFCLINSVFSQNLKIAEGQKDTLRRIHLAFESNKGDSILYYKGYSVIFSYTYDLPRYTFNLLTVDQLTTNSTRLQAKRSSSFFPTSLPNGTLSATDADYSKSGYDRGHMVPAGDFVWNKELKDETFFYTNVNPQIPVLNRGIWANLENRIRDKVLKYSENAYVVTGVVFNSSYTERIGINGLHVPVAFFKIVYFDKRKTMFSFMFDNTVDQYVGDITDYQVTVDFIEQITGEDFFDLLEDDVESKLESVILNFDD
jgi:endonuclease G, mitochondrial